jgi:fructosamine-3-kinase
MTIEQIPTPPQDSSLPEHINRLRRNAPHYLQSLVEKSFVFITIRSLDQLKAHHIKLLSGGNNAVTWMIRKQDDYVVVKLDYRGIKAEAEALEAWKQRGASVVSVKSRGTIEQTKRLVRPIRYIILEGIVTSLGQPAPLAIDYVKMYPSRTRSIGRAMGRELAIMHSAIAKRTFGEFADMDGANTQPFQTWNAYLLQFLKNKHQTLLDLGFSEKQLKTLRSLVKSTRFPRTGRYLHGDYSLRNTVVETARPLRVRMIDPNPLIGHPLWDLAIVQNNYDFANRKTALKPGHQHYAQELTRWHEFWRGTMLGYKATSKHKVDKHKLLLTQMVQQVFQYDARLNKLIEMAKDLAKDDDLIVRRDALTASINRLLKT